MRTLPWLAVGLFSGQAHGGPAAAASGIGQSAVVEEIVVTAQRIEERAQSVPIAITAFAAEQLTARQVSDVGALRHFAPNLDIAPTQGNSLTATIAMRGQVELSNVPTVDPAVGLFLDGSYIARVTGANLNLVDIERVEILRGPQGTLFGRNTIGGAINIVPNKPEKRFGGYVELLAGNYDKSALTGVLNTPVLGERGAVRLAAQHSEHSGFARTVVLNRDLSDDDTDFIRAQFRLSPEDRWDLNLSFDYSDTSASNQWITLLSAMPPATFLPAASGHPEDSLENYRDPVTRLTHASHAGGLDSRARGAAASFTYPFATHTLKGIAAFRDLDLLIVETDLDGTPYDIATQLRQEQAERQESYELQSFGHGFDRRLEWIGGLYYFNERVTRYGLANQLAPLSVIENNNSGNVRNTSRSAYLQLATHLAPSVRVRAGARHVQDTRQLTSFNSRWSEGVEICSLDPSILDSPETCQATLPPRQFDYVPFNLSIDYSPRSELMLYAKYSRGQRAGGYNFRVTDSLAALPFEPEMVDAYELGVKVDLLDGTLRMNAALFRTDYQDIQLTQVVRDSLQRPHVVTVNAGEARIEGGEFEVSANLRRAVLALGVGHTNARYTQIDPGVVDVTLDSDFRNTPAWTFSAALDVPFDFRNAASSLHVDYSWRDEVFYAADPLARQEEFHTVNARFSTRLTGSGVEFSLWCRNVADTRYITRAIANGNGGINALPADPRTFGATITYRFGAG
jgi:iron complex outermembrane receptor protein